MTETTFSAYYTKSNLGGKNSTEWCKQIFGILLKSCFRQYVCSPKFPYESFIGNVKKCKCYQKKNYQLKPIY